MTDAELLSSPLDESTYLGDTEQRIQDNDPTLSSLKILNGGYMRRCYEDLQKNTQVKKLEVEWGTTQIGCLGEAYMSYDAFALMMAKNESIEKLVLVFNKDSGTDLASVLRALVRHCDQLRLKSLSISDERTNHFPAASQSGALILLATFLEEKVLVTESLEVSVEDEACSDEENVLLKSMFSSHAKSIKLLNTCYCYTPHDIAEILEQQENLDHIESLLLGIFKPYALGLDRLTNVLGGMKGLVSLDLVGLSRHFDYFLTKLPLMRNLQRLRLRVFLAEEYLELVCHAVRAHGNLTSLTLDYAIDEGASSDVATAGLSLAVFNGLNELNLRIMLQNDEMNVEERRSMGDSVVKYIGSCLQGHQLLRKVDIDVHLMSIGGFRYVANEVLPTLPALESVGLFGCHEEENDERAHLVLETVERLQNIVEFNHCCPLSLITKRQHDEIAYQCERNRIDFPKLLASDPPLALCPLIFPKIRNKSVFYSLLLEKQDLLIKPSWTSRGTKRKLRK